MYKMIKYFVHIIFKIFYFNLYDIKDVFLNEYIIIFLKILIFLL